MAAPATSAAAPVRYEGPVQIISVNKTGDGFELHEAELRYVLNKVPTDMKIAVVSVVGAFRTGKSFLLDLLLRYLRFYDGRGGNIVSTGDVADGQAEWLMGDNGILEGNAATGAPDYHEVGADGSVVSGARAGFKWQRGRDRMTTGIWVWDTPFVRQLPGSSERVAVLLMDTQGMFDAKTSQMLTATIFGLSTLISSYQIYNVSNRIQEDNLQNLALFTEYGRIVAAAQAEADADPAAAAPEAASGGAGTSSSSSTAAANGDQDIPRGLNRAKFLRAVIQGAEDSSAGSAAAATPEARAARAEEAAAALKMRPPFQRLEFLVRDYPNYNVRDFSSANVAAVNKEMREYIQEVFAHMSLKDTRTTREQILACFEAISCYMLVYPGDKVVDEADFEGRILDIKENFRRLVERYAHVVFCEQLAAKRINGRDITAGELGNLVVSYVKLFHNQSTFPMATDLLAATADANNRSAFDKALRTYRTGMDTVAGPGKAYMKEPELLAEEDKWCRVALEQFDVVANFGPRTTIRQYREEVLVELARMKREYIASNAEREPWKSAQPVILALACVAFFWVLKQLLDLTCSSWAESCRRGSQFAGFVYSTILIALIFVMWQSGQVTAAKISAIFTAVQQVAAATGAVGGAAAAAAGPGAGGAGTAGNVSPTAATGGAGGAASAGGAGGLGSSDGLRKRTGAAGRL